jgi:uncharacterized membrane protein YraQ (UPF0718 family)
MEIIIPIFIVSLIISFLFNPQKTLTGIKKGLIMFLKILPTLLSVIIIISISLYLTPKEFLIKYFGSDSGILGYVLAAFIGSITLIPAFIAYPMCGFLINNGISYPIIAIFVTTLLMVGIVTIPIEKKYFGIKVTLLRNSLSFIGAIIVGILIGLLFEII